MKGSNREDELVISLSTEGHSLSAFREVLYCSSKNPWMKGQKPDSRADAIPHWTCDPEASPNLAAVHFLTCIKMENLMTVPVLGTQPQNYLEEQVQLCW